MEPMAILNRVSRAMGERRLKITDVARRSGLSYQTVFDLYHDRAQRIDLTTLDKLCRALECSVGELLEYVPGSSN
jgi:putative transcriptional regulator